MIGFSIFREDPIHISQVVSKAKCYYCIDCNSDIVAATGLLNKHYFILNFNFCISSLTFFWTTFP